MSQERIAPIKIHNSRKKANSFNKGNKLNINVNKRPLPNNSIYTTQKDNTIIFISCILLIAGISIIVYSIYSSISQKDIKKLLLALGSLICVAVFFIFAYLWKMYSEITVDYSAGDIIFKTVKFIPFFTIINTVQIKQIRGVTVKNNFQKKTNSYYAFEIYITLKDGTKDEVCTGVDKDGEGRNVCAFLKKNLPKNISFSGNLSKKCRN